MKKLFLSLFLVLTFGFPGSVLAVDQPVVSRVILLIDVSGSMQGEKIDTAKSASAALIDQIPIGIDVSIITFNKDVTVQLQPTPNKDEAKAAATKITAIGNTSLYDGVNKALDLAAGDGTTRILLISDGNDTSSTSTLKNTLGMIDEKTAPITIFSLNKTKVANDVLIEIANRSHGEFIQLTSASQLPSLFSDFTQVIKKQYAADTFNIIPAKKTEIKKLRILGPAILILLFGLITTLGINSFYRNRVIGKHRENILEKYDSNRNTLKEFDLNAIRKRLFYTKFLSRYLRVQQEKLDLAGISNQQERWVIGILMVLFTFIIFTAGIFGNIFISVIISILLIFGLRSAIINNLINKKLHNFEESLPEALLIMASGLRSGLNLLQTLESVANDGNNEVARQFRRVMAELQIGTNLEIALEKVANRMNSNDLRWTVSALAIQREVGGNLSEILATAAATIKTRGEIRREVRTLSAEGRTSAYVLVALPIGILIFTLFSQPNYFKLMFSSFIGVGFILLLILLMTVGWIWVKRVVNIKV